MNKTKLHDYTSLTDNKLIFRYKIERGREREGERGRGRGRERGREREKVGGRD